MAERSALDYSFDRYLSSKKSVDDRALNHSVWNTLRAALPAERGEAPLRVLEIGAGIGTMLERMIETGMLSTAHYTALDLEEPNITSARRRLTGWAEKRGLHPRWHGDDLELEGDGCRVKVRFMVEDLFSFIEHAQGHQTWDLLVAHAFLDLLDLQAALPRIFQLLSTEASFQAVYYFTINFDGVTLLEPVIDPAFDEQLINQYHRSMDERLIQGKRSGDSRTGRHLFYALRQAGASILAAGSSDWVVFPDESKRYPQDEAFFLHFIIHTLDLALRDCSELDHDQFQRWIAARHTQIDKGELVYIAHQLDFVGHFPARKNPDFLP